MRPDAAFHIVEELPKTMEKYGIRHLDDIRGMLSLG